MTPEAQSTAVDSWLDAHHDELIAFRRHLHAHPEVSGEEYETTDYIAERLDVAGLAVRRIPGGTGLLCDLGAKSLEGSDRVGRLALRADIDALAMEDDKEVPYRSTMPGVAHACGHDVHTTVVLGAGLALADLFGESGGPAERVRLVFQPAEEVVPGGALDVIAAGGLNGVESIYGVHCDPRIEAGKVGLRDGPITSASDMMTVTLHGPGGHTARPEQTADLVSIAATVVRELADEVGHRLGERPVSIVFGAIRAGDAANVIPARAELRGTIRTPHVDVWNEIRPIVERSLESIVEPYGATTELDYVQGQPPVVNDPEAAAAVERAARLWLGDEAVVPTGQSVGGDDFSWYLQRVRGCYTRLGVRNPDGSLDAIDLHAGCFDVDERAIATGVKLLVATALTAP